MIGRNVTAVVGMALALASAASSVWAQDPEAAPRTLAEVLEASAPEDWRRLEPENVLYLELATGSVVIELAPSFAPRHVDNIRAMVRGGWFDGGAIVRSQDNYVVQWQIAAAAAQSGAGVAEALPPEFEVAAAGLPFSPLPDPDPYAPAVGFTNGFPVARDGSGATTWMAHCYGVVGVARGEDPGTGNGSSLYVVIGQSPRHLDRNLSMVGRVVSGMPLLSTLPRGTGPLGFYEDSTDAVPIRSARLGSQLAADQRAGLELLRTDTPTFDAVIAARRHRGEEFFVHPTDRIGLCNVPLPVRATPAGARE